MAIGKPLLKEKDKPKKQRKKTRSQLKKEADRVFSIFTRKKYANEKGEVECYTCGVRKFWKELQCGHFVSRVYLATRFDESNTRPQCIGCNIFGNGKSVEFARRLEEENRGLVALLYKKAQEIIPNFNYAEIINKYKETPQT